MNLTAFGETIRPIGRTVTAKGDTITLFSIKAERQIVYNLQVGNEKALQLKSLQAVDSALTVINCSLLEKNELLNSQIQEIKVEIKEWKETNQNCENRNKSLASEVKKTKASLIIYKVATVGLSAICTVLIIFN